MPTYDSTDLKSVLNYIRVQFGSQIFAIHGKTGAILSDLAPRLTKERNMMRVLDESGILERFSQISSKDEESQKKFVAIAKSRLVDERFMDLSLSCFYIKLLCEVFQWDYIPFQDMSFEYTLSFSCDLNRGVNENLKVHDKILFGNYFVNERTKKSQPIEWEVIDRNQDRALLLSKKLLDTHIYSEKKDWVTWDICELRKWLNDTFLNAAFTSSEQSRICECQIHTPDNPLYRTHGGGDVADRIFILDSFEVSRLLPDNASRKAVAMEYAFDHGAFCSSNDGSGLWRLRTPGFTLGMTSVVEPDGNIDYYGDSAFTDYVGIRPSLWLKTT